MDKLKIEAAIKIKSASISRVEEVFSRLCKDRVELEKQLAEIKDHQRLYKGQPVIGTNSDSSTLKGFYIGIDNSNGAHRYKIDWRSSTVWAEECEPDLDFKSITNWIEWNGCECPVDLDAMVNVVLKDGWTVYAKAARFSWDEKENPVIRYAVIDLPVFIE
jgi:hypothetical protein